ncbi:MAG: cell division protein FtsL [Pseudomonadota bacterium]|nr:cell division protein FtsL [Pseudomonadota bacterium]
MGAVAIEPKVKAAKLNRDIVRGGMVAAARVSRQVFGAIQQPRVMMTAVLVVVLVISALGVVVSSFQNRKLFNELAQLQEARDAYQREWSQLLLEQSALSAHGRVERLAAERFGMVVPGRQDIVLVPLMGQSAQ